MSLSIPLDWTFETATGWMGRWEWTYGIHRRLSDAYYAVRSWFFPYNRLVIRNMPRTFMEPGAQMPHAMFSLLCQFVERSRGDIAAFEKWSQLEGNGCLREMLDLYRWYTTINWKDPVGWPGDGSDHDTQMEWADRIEHFESVIVPEKCKQLAGLMRSMWS